MVLKHRARVVLKHRARVVLKHRERVVLKHRERVVLKHRERVVLVNAKEVRSALNGRGNNLTSEAKMLCPMISQRWAYSRLVSPAPYSRLRSASTGRNRFQSPN